MRQPPQPGAHLGLYRHGDTVSERAALELLARPDFAEHWAILPNEDGAAVTLAWGDACTLEELERVNEWIRCQTADFQAAKLPRGSG